MAPLALTVIGTGGVSVLTPPARVFIPSAEDRTFTPSAEDRTYRPAAEGRTSTPSAEIAPIDPPLKTVL